MKIQNFILLAMSLVTMPTFAAPAETFDQLIEDLRTALSDVKSARQVTKKDGIKIVFEAEAYIESAVLKKVLESQQKHQDSPCYKGAFEVVKATDLLVFRETIVGKNTHTIKIYAKDDHPLNAIYLNPKTGQFISTPSCRL